MRNQPEESRPNRRYIRIAGPFEGHHVGPPRTQVLVYDLNEGGGLISFFHEQPAATLLELQITLPYEGRITVHAEAVSRQPFGLGVRFVDVDDHTTLRLARAVAALANTESSRRSKGH
jgi:hypothetical protein